MKNLFAYGTLMCEDIMEDVSGYILTFVSGYLQGYVRRKIKNQVYPGIIEDTNFSVKGKIYKNIPEKAWKRLDSFEGEMYFRKSVFVNLNEKESLSCETYVVKKEFINYISNKEWDLNKFLLNGKNLFIKSYIGYEDIYK